MKTLCFFPGKWWGSRNWGFRFRVWWVRPYDCYWKNDVFIGVGGSWTGVCMYINLWFACDLSSSLKLSMPVLFLCRPFGVSYCLQLHWLITKCVFDYVYIVEVKSQVQSLVGSLGLNYYHKENWSQVFHSYFSDP